MACGELAPLGLVPTADLIWIWWGAFLAPFTGDPLFVVKEDRSIEQTGVVIRFRYQDGSKRRTWDDANSAGLRYVNYLLCSHPLTLSPLNCPFVTAVKGDKGERAQKQERPEADFG